MNLRLTDSDACNTLINLHSANGIPADAPKLDSSGYPFKLFASTCGQPHMLEGGLSWGVKEASYNYHAVFKLDPTSWFSWDDITVVDKPLSGNTPRLVGGTGVIVSLMYAYMYC